MVVGSGLLATSLNKYISDDNVVIFASGVSNSNETKLEEFNRELNLLSDFFKENRILVYFSTVSIYDNSLSNSLYVKHKMEIEELIQNKIDKYLIIRLPIVVSNSINPYTLFNFIKNKICTNEEITIYKNAFRYLVDIDDIVDFVDELLFNYRYNKIVNFSPERAISALDIAKNMEVNLNKKAKIIELDKGANYKIDFSIDEVYNSKFFLKINNEKYYSKIIKKYNKC